MPDRHNYALDGGTLVRITAAFVQLHVNDATFLFTKLFVAALFPDGAICSACK